MTREQYMQTLYRYLSHMPADELEEVRVYYHELFEEAGIGRHDMVPESFGNPKRVALEILADVDMNKGYPGDEKKPQASKGFWQRVKENWGIILLAVLAIPVGIPLILAVLGLAVGVIALVGGLIIGMGAMVVAPLVVLVKGVLLTAPTIFFLLGIIVLGIGLLILWVAFIAWLIKVIANAIRKRTREKKEARHE